MQSKRFKQLASQGTFDKMLQEDRNRYLKRKRAHEVPHTERLIDLGTIRRKFRRPRLGPILHNRFDRGPPNLTVRERSSV